MTATWEELEEGAITGFESGDGDQFDYDVRTLPSRQPDGTFLTAPQKRLIAFLRQGLSEEIAANAAGMSYEEAVEFMQSDAAAKYAQQKATQLQTARVLVTRDMLTLMLLEERERSGTASEGISAIREIGRLNGLYPEQADSMAKVRAYEQGVTVEGQVHNKNTIANKTDEELARIAGVTL